MSKNPVVPYAIIAVVGILLVVLVSFVGVNQREAIQNDGNGEEQQADSADGETTDDPEEIFKNTCASCHGADLTGENGPNLTEVGSRLSEEEIHDIITNGTDGGMPPGLANEDQTNALAEWLSEMK